jgi:hypothetical protein
MSDNYPVDSGDLRARGTKGVMSAIGGVGLMVVSALVASPIVAGIIGGGLALLGLGGVFGKTKADRTTGGLVLAVGGIALASAFLHGPLSGLLGLGGFALLAFGAWNIFKFVKGLRSRA